MGEQGSSVTTNRGGVHLVDTSGLPFTELHGITHHCHEKTKCHTDWYTNILRLLLPNRNRVILASGNVSLGCGSILLFSSC